MLNELLTEDMFMGRKMRLYFAHNFDLRKKFRRLELQLERRLGIELFNPFYDNPSRWKEMEALDSGKLRRFEVPDPSGLVARDLASIAKSDGLLAIIDEPTIGTTLEIANAKLMCKPVYVVSRAYWKHPWIIVYATHRFKTLREFERFMKAKGGQRS